MKKSDRLALLALVGYIRELNDRDIPAFSSLDSTEGIVRTSAGIAHPKEEMLTVSTEDFNMSFSPVNGDNINLVLSHLKGLYG